MRINPKRLFHLLPILLVLLSASFCANFKQNPPIKVTTIRCNDKLKPHGVDLQDLTFGWQMASSQRGQLQNKWQVVVASNKENIEKGNYDVWNSGIKSGDENVQVKYQGPSLNPAHRYFWEVRVWNQNGEQSSWSEPGSFVTGLSGPGSWQKAQWIGYETMPDSMKILPGVTGYANDLKSRGKRRPVIPRFRHEFEVDKPVKEAFLFISGVGQYEASLNGEKIGDRFLSPAWTDYSETVLYNTYDVTKYLSDGGNTLGVVVGNGFYNVNRERYHKLVIAYGMPKMICQLRLRYEDGSTDIISSGSDWKTTPSPIIFSSIYGGEDYDARKEQPGWNKSGFDAPGWKPVLMVDPPEGDLKAQQSYPVKAKDTLSVQHTRAPKPGIFVGDFGQNASGIIQMKVKGKKGQKVKITPAELLNNEGLVDQDATGDPYYYTYTLKGNGVETWQPKFSYYGFRYVQIEGAKPDSLKRENDEAELVGLKMLHTRNSEPRTGNFATSYKLFNQIYDLINWAIKSNLQHVVTDCPHREKLGWLEQTYLMGGSIHYNYDVHHLYKKLVHDMMDAQTADGLIPNIAPEYVNFGSGGFRDSPEWGSAGVILPWQLFKWYDDKRVLVDAWPMMTQYVRYLKSRSEHHIVSYGLGDWYDLGPQMPGYAQLTPKALTATAIYYYDVKLLSKIAPIIGKENEEKKYTNWADEIRQAFNQKFFNDKTKVYSTGSQTAMAMPLVVGLVNKADWQNVFTNLKDSIRTNNKALTAGDIGFHFLVEALQNGNASQLIYDMNARTDVPGYGYQIKKGATSLTESWSASSRVSNNHLMLGHLMQWFYGGLGGIDQTENSTAYKHIIIEPQFAGGIDSTSTSFESPNGKIVSKWEVRDGEGHLKVEIPVNSDATVIIPAADTGNISESGRKVGDNPDVQILSRGDQITKLKLGSGRYNFEFIPSRKE